MRGNRLPSILGQTRALLGLVLALLSMHWVIVALCVVLKRAVMP